MSAKTHEQVQAEVSRLWSLKNEIQPVDGGRERHVAAIDSQIAVLERCLSVEAARELVSSDAVGAQYICDCAVEAAEWRDGALVVDEPPSVSWKGMVRPAVKAGSVGTEASFGPLSDRAAFRILQDVAHLGRTVPSIRLTKVFVGSPHVLH